MSAVTPRVLRAAALGPVRGVGDRARRRRSRIAPLTVLVAAVAALLLGGCRAADRTAASGPPATSASAVPEAGMSDPLAGVEAGVGAVERDIDADAVSDGR
jgi:hypothetical protein